MPPHCCGGCTCAASTSATAGRWWAFGRRQYEVTVHELRHVRNIAHRFGGSHAQRDLLDLTLIEAAIRSGRHALAAALAAERAAARPTSPLARLLQQRAHALKPAA